MTFLKAVSDYLWRPFQIQSRATPETVETKLRRKVIPMPAFNLLVHWYGHPYGKVEKGRFVINFVPFSSVLSFGAGLVRISGRIEKAGRGSRIYGKLPGPAPAIWALLILSFGLLSSLSLSPTDERLNILFVSLMISIFTVGMFFFDRSRSHSSVLKILATLKRAAK